MKRMMESWMTVWGSIGQASPDADRTTIRPRMSTAVTRNAAKVIAVASLALILNGASARPANDKLSPELKHAQPENIDVIVQYKSQPTEANHRNVEGMGGKLKHEFA